MKCYVLKIWNCSGDLFSTDTTHDKYFSGEKCLEVAAFLCRYDNILMREKSETDMG